MKQLKQRSDLWQTILPSPEEEDSGSVSLRTW